MLRLPEVYTILPGVPFARALVTQLWHEYKDNLLALSDVQLYLPNRRSTRAMADMFLEVSDGQATLLPRMTPLGDIDEEDLLESDPLMLDDDPFAHPAIPSLDRQMILTQMVLKKPEMNVTPTEAFRLAGDLGRLLDRAHTENIDLGQLADLVTGELAEHWEKTRQFLDIVTAQWPHILKAGNQNDRTERRNQIFAKKVAALRAHPPTHRIIAAGSTGSIPSTAKLLDVIARLPNGSVVLPGIDPGLDDRIWDAIDEVHPYFYQKRLVEMMDIDRRTVKIWPGLRMDTQPEKIKLAHYALQPQEIFDLSAADVAVDNLDCCDLIAAEDPLHEAKIIALKLREVLNTEHDTAMVVTPDRVLAQYIQQEMLRWNIVVNDSGGQPLGDTPVGVLLKLVAGLPDSTCQQTHLLSILRHPLFRLHPPVERRAGDIHALETVLRRQFLLHGGLLAFAQTYDHPLLTDTLEILKPFLLGKPQGLAEWLEVHIRAVEALATTATVPGAEILWRNEDGEAAAQLLYKLREAALATPLELSPRDYTAFIASAMSQVMVRPRYGAHPRLRILSPVEARLLDADLVIVAGLNEGVWPSPVTADTWLSRPMQQAMGFGSLDRRLGQSSLDFMLLFCTPRVIVTWSKKREGVTAHPARWLQQIFAVLKRNHTGSGNPPMLNVPDVADWAAYWDEPENIIPVGAPEFAPPLRVRPHRLPVTDISLWQNDPYGLYAKRILHLKKLDTLDRQVGASDWGNAAHKIVEEFFTDKGFSHPDPAGNFDAIGRQVLQKYPLNTAQSKAWNGKLAAIRDWLLAFEPENAARIFTEQDMNLKMPLANGTSFELYGRADRIDVHQGAVTITDYKTGAVPPDKQIRNGAAPQMPLLGLLAQNAIGLQNHAVTLRYIKLNGRTANPADVRPLKNSEDLIAVNRDYLQQLLDNYYTAKIPYQAKAQGDGYDNYTHLKRVAEWALLDEDGDTEEDAA